MKNCLSALALSAFTALTAIGQQTTELYQNFSLGHHAIGFQKLHITDYSRILKNDFRKIQVALWYPTEKSGPEKLQLSDYFDLYLTEDETSELPSNPRQFWQQHFEDLNKGAQFEKLWNSEALATDGLLQASKKYPVILYAAGGQGESFENFIACEVLASHGFIVAAIPSLGTFLHQMEISSEGLITQTNDLLAVLRYLNQQDYVMTDQVGAFGWSWGGLAAIYLETVYPATKAVASWDGSVAGHEDKIAKLPFYAIEKIVDPTFFVASESTAKRTKAFYEKLLYSQSSLVAFDSIEHSDFNSYGYLANYFSGSERNQKQHYFYPWLVNASVDFFNHHLIDKAPAPFQVSKAKNLTGEYHFHENLPAPLREDELIDLIKNKGVENAFRTYSEFKKRDSTLILFDAFEMTKVAFSLVRDSVRSAEAVKVMEMVLMEHPNSPSSYALKARIHETRNELPQALHCISVAYGMKAGKKKPAETVFYEDINWYKKNRGVKLQTIAPC